MNEEVSLDIGTKLGLIVAEARTSLIRVRWEKNI